jgi:hypothetical protein
MTNSAIPDVITVVGSSYLQPIADLLERLLKRPVSGAGPSGVSGYENGYSASIVVLLVALLESYVARLRFVRRTENIPGHLSTSELLAKFFPALPTREHLVEVLLVRNVLAHNHIWHLDVSEFEELGAPTLATPQELGFQTNKHYEQVVDIGSRKTCLLRLNVSPTSVDRSDVRKVFDVVWKTLEFMQAQNYGHTPLAGSTVGFRMKRRQFAELLKEITDEGGGRPP